MIRESGGNCPTAAALAGENGDALRRLPSAGACAQFPVGAVRGSAGAPRQALGARVRSIVLSPLRGMERGLQGACPLCYALELSRLAGSTMRGGVKGPIGRRAGVAQLVEHLICNQRVGGSSPFASSRFEGMSTLRGIAAEASQAGRRTLRENDPSNSFPEPILRGSHSARLLETLADATTDAWWAAPGQPAAPGKEMLGMRAQLAEWLMAADCKSAAPSGLRRFESSPVHQDF